MGHAPFLGQIQNIQDTSGTLPASRSDGPSMHRTMSTNWGAMNQLEHITVTPIRCQRWYTIPILTAQLLRLRVL